MGSRRSNLRAELWRLLHGDLPIPDSGPKVPDLSSIALLHELISIGAAGSGDDARAVYEHLPLLINRFFGFAVGTGWIENCSDLPSSHRDALLETVCPHGPVMSFCAASSPEFASEPKPEELRYEFPLSNFPSFIADEITDLADGEIAPSQTDSAIAPFVAPCFRRDPSDRANGYLLLTTTDYFMLCMVFSPSYKWTHLTGSSSYQGRRTRARRSASLPSTRAMFNRLLAQHLAATEVACTVATCKSLLVPACFDCLLYPLASASTFDLLPNPSTSAADAIATVLLAVLPENPDKLLLSSRKVGGHECPGRELCSSALFACAHDCLRTTFSFFPTGPGGPLGTLAAYVRVLALCLAPWNQSVVSSVQAALFPKRSPVTSSAGSGFSSQPLTAITSTLSNLNSAFPMRFSTNYMNGTRNQAVEQTWMNSEYVTAKRDADVELISLAIIKCANCHLGALSEGIRALTLLAEAVSAFATFHKTGTLRLSSIELVSDSLQALREQSLQVERRSGRKFKDFSTGLANALGIVLQKRGVLQGVASIVGVGSNNSGVSRMVSHITGETSRRRLLRDRRRSELEGAIRENIPFLGSVWEKPIEDGEFQLIVVLAYRLALWIEDKSGILPNIRFLGRKSVFCGILFTFAVAGYILSIK